MPVDLQVILASEFVRLDASEHLDFEASKKVLQAMAQACLKRGVVRAMVDIRAIPAPPKPAFTPSQLAALVGTFWEAGFGRGQRLAVLYQEDPHGGARTFAFIGRMYGWQVRAFSEFEQAFHWLSEETVGRPELGKNKRGVSPGTRLSETKRPRRNSPLRRRMTSEQKQTRVK